MPGFCQGCAGVVKDRGFHNLSSFERNMGKTWTMTKQSPEHISTDAIERPAAWRSVLINLVIGNILEPRLMGRRLGAGSRRYP